MREVEVHVVGYLMCFFFYLVSHFCTVTPQSQLISLSSNVDFFVVRIKFVINYTKYDLVLVHRSFGEKRKKIKEYELFIDKSFLYLDKHPYLR